MIALRLKSWKAKLLSKGGRLTLLKATLASIPNYHLSLFTIPGLVAIRIESLFRKFLWNNEEEHHRYHLVDWKLICRSLREGGLGMRSIKDHNRALLAKWLWRFGNERDILWRRVVVARFGLASIWKARWVRVRHGCGIWKSIQKLREVFWNCIRFNLGLGKNICFWEDSWVGEFPWKDSFRSLFSLTIDPKEFVTNAFDDGGNVWIPRSVGI